MENLQGKTIIVTGATSGVGRESAMRLALMGCRLAIVGRDNKKGARLVDELIRITGNSDVLFFQADLSVQSEIRRLASDLDQNLDRIDVLLNNAGALFTSRQESVDNIEMTLALNHLGYFLLTHLLVDKLIASAPSRIVNVSSVAHKSGRLNLADIQYRERYFFGWGAYAQSKLCNIMFTYHLDQKLKGSGVTVNALHPGFVNSQFGNNNNGLHALAFRALKNLSAVSVKEGAESSVYLVSSPEINEMSGGYYYRCKRVKSSSASYNQIAQKKLWDFSRDLVSL